MLICVLQVLYELSLNMIGGRFFGNYRLQEKVTVVCIDWKYAYIALIVLF